MSGIINKPTSTDLLYRFSFLVFLCFFFACQKAENKHDDLKGEKQKLGKFKKGEREILLKIKPNPFEDIWVPVGRLRIALDEEYCVHQNYLQRGFSVLQYEYNRFSSIGSCHKIEGYGCFGGYNQCSDSIDRVTIRFSINPENESLSTLDSSDIEKRVKDVVESFQTYRHFGQSGPVYFFRNNDIGYFVTQHLENDSEDVSGSWIEWSKEVIDVDVSFKNFGLSISFECMPNDTIGFRERSLKALRSIQIESL